MTGRRLLPGLLIAMTGGGAPAQETSPTLDPRIDAVLTRLERRSDGLRDIQCRVTFLEDDQMNLVRRSKTGTLRFLMLDPNPHFLIHFERTETDGVIGKQEWYLFDGLWFYQGLERILQVTKQEIARPGEKMDLFDLERAPFPLPFGQKKETILRSFEVELAEPTPADPPETDHLVCVPRPGTRMSRKYDRLDFFVRRDVDLPSRIVASQNGGLEIKTADFPDLTTKSINSGLTAKDIGAPDRWKKDGYKVVEEKLIGD